MQARDLPQRQHTARCFKAPPLLLSPALPLTLRERVERWGDQMVTAPALF